jgi:hypothetical protein
MEMSRVGKEGAIHKPHICCFIILLLLTLLVTDIIESHNVGVKLGGECEGSERY